MKRSRQGLLFAEDERWLYLQGETKRGYGVKDFAALSLKDYKDLEPLLSSFKLPTEFVINEETIG